MRRSVMNTLAGLSLAGGLVSLQANAAQDPNAQAAPATTTAQNVPTAAVGDQLSEVVVTAQFRQESAQSAPIAITAINAAMLEQRGQTSLVDVANEAPSVTLKQAGAAFGPSMVASIRGIGQYDFDPALEPGVGIYVDDVYFATLTGSVLDLMDLDRVEVLRGPQGTLSGKNSIGGSVKLFSRKPTAEPDSSVSILYGSRNHVEARGATGFVLAPEHLFARISGVVNHQDGYSDTYDFGCANPGLGVPSGFVNRAGNCRTGTLGGKDYAAIRLALRWVLNDNLEVNVAGDLTHDTSEAPATTLLYANNGVTYYGLPYNSATVPLIPANRYSSYINFCLPPLTKLSLETVPPGVTTSPAYCGQNNIHMISWGGSGTIDWKISDTLSLKSITAQRGYTTDWWENNSASPWPNNLGAEHLSHHQFSQELRLNGALGKLMDYTVGGFYFRELSIYGTHQDLAYVTALIPPIAAFPGSYDFLGNDPIEAHTKAGFLHTVWHLTDQLDLTGAVRYTKEDKDYTFVRLSTAGLPFALLCGPTGCLNGTTGRYEGSKTDYRANINYRWTEDLITYAQVSTGFKGGGVNPRPFNVAQVRPFSPESLTNYEIGLKSSWLDHKLRANLTGFYGKYKDIQETLLACPQFGGPGPCALPINAGDADIKGVEFETELRPFTGLELDGSVSYVNFNFTRLAPNTGLTTSSQPPYSPKKKANLGAQYAFQLGAAGSLTPRFDISYQDQIYTNAVNGELNRVPAYALMNLRFTWRAEKGDWEAAVQALNFTDKFYYLNKFDLTGAGAGEVTGQPGPPREIALTVKHTM